MRCWHSSTMGKVGRCCHCVVSTQLAAPAGLVDHQPADHSASAGCRPTRPAAWLSVVSNGSAGRQHTSSAAGCSKLHRHSRRRRGRLLRQGLCVLAMMHLNMQATFNTVCDVVCGQYILATVLCVHVCGEESAKKCVWGGLAVHLGRGGCSTTADRQIGCREGCLPGGAHCWFGWGGCSQTVRREPCGPWGQLLLA